MSAPDGDPEEVAAAAQDWSATAEALLDVADRLAAQLPEVEERMHGRTGVVTGRSLRRAVVTLRADAADAAAGGAALADVAEALREVRLDPSDASRHRLASRMREAARVMRRIHEPTPPRDRSRAVTAALPVSGSASSAPASMSPDRGSRPGAVASAGLLTAGVARAVGAVVGSTGVPGAASGGSPIPAGRGRSHRDRRSRDRRTTPAGLDAEGWADDEGVGPAVLGAD